MFPKFPMDSQQAPNNTLLYPKYYLPYVLLLQYIIV